MVEHFLLKEENKSLKRQFEEMKEMYEEKHWEERSWKEKDAELGYPERCHNHCFISIVLG